MSKSVLISIAPKWCELIATGKKAVEVRKSRPKIDTPFRCYIYCTKNGLSIYGNEKSYVTDYANLLSKAAKEGFEATSGFSKWNGKIIGEFVCNEITCFEVPYLAYQNEIDSSILSKSCMTYDQLHKYAHSHSLYGWHISDFEFYDEPKELKEFLKPCICPQMPYCPTCPVGYEYISETEAEFFREAGECDTEWVCQNYLKKAPQSWCYVV